MIPPTAANLAAVTIQAGVLVLVGAPLPRVLGIRSPRARLAYWRALLVACLLLPVLQPWLPEPAAAGSTAPAVGEQVSAVSGTAPASQPRLVSAVRLPALDVLDLLAAGILARLAWFAAGLLTLSRLRRQADPLEPRPPSVVEAARLAGADAEFRQSARPTRPVTFGILRPVVLVPSDFGEFEADEQRAIACHELFHVRRRDWARTLADEIIRAAAWFHPAAWWLTRQIRLAREQVVDQEVVQRLGSRRPYLDALLRLASPDRGGSPFPAPLFLGRSHLSERIALLLKEARMSRPRLALSFLAMAAVLVLSARAVTAAFPLHGGLVVQAPAPAAGAAHPGQVKAQPAATPAASKVPRRIHDVRPAFPAGAPDAPLLLSMTIDEAGTVQEVATIAGSADLAEIAARAVRQWKFAPNRVAVTSLVGFNPAAAGELRDQPPVLVGGTVRAPSKIKDVKPVYPADARDARVQGVVILQTRIASDGAVSEARVLRSVPMLDQAALAAVLQWKFVPLGFPVEMTVTVNFTLDAGPRKPGAGVGMGVGGGAGVPGGTPGGVTGGVKAGVPGGVKGGVPGGVKGGIEGGVSGGLVDTAAGPALRVGGDVKAPQKTYDVKPVYPREALDARIEGVVVLEARIGPDGKVTEAKILRSIPQLDQAALDAVRQWEFTPTYLNGEAVSVIMTVTVNFALQ